MSEEEDDNLFPDKVAFPWVIVAALIGLIFGFMTAAAATPSGCLPK